MFEDIFIIRRGEPLYKQYMQRGKIPYVSASSVNNGVSDFTDKPNRQPNMISLAYDGSIGSTFYQNTPWFATEKIVSLELKHRELNEYIALFLCRLIGSQKDKYSYGYKWSVGLRMNRGKLLLPVNEVGLPDYDFMEAYIAATEEKILQRYREFVQAVDAAQIVPLEQKIWRPFIIGDLFRLEAGKCSQANQLKKSADGVPYIGATNRNNGVLDFVEPDEKFISRGNAIAFVCDGEGSMGYSFYKAEDCIATTNIIFGYADFLNRYVGAFITTVADKVRGKYSYNYKRRLLRLKREQLMLPVNECGAPDFEYMAAYVKNLVAEKYRKYLAYQSKMYSKEFLAR